MGTFNVIGVSCSPRKNGNTDILIQQVLATAAEDGAAVEFVRVSDMKLLAMPVGLVPRQASVTLRTTCRVFIPSSCMLTELLSEALSIWGIV